MSMTSYQNAAIDYTKEYLERVLRMEIMVCRYMEKRRERYMT
jgi:hypothetical protein